MNISKKRGALGGLLAVTVGLAVLLAPTASGAAEASTGKVAAAAPAAATATTQSPEVIILGVDENGNVRSPQIEPGRLDPNKEWLLGREFMEPYPTYEEFVKIVEKERAAESARCLKRPDMTAKECAELVAAIVPVEPYVLQYPDGSLK